MRITNSMITGRMLLNINRNMRYVDKLYTQQATGKVIQYPSDNPIIASRAIKLRTIVSETDQYKRNVNQGLNWMKITEGSFINLGEIFKSLDERLVEGSSDPSGTWEDRKNMVTEIEQFVKQLGKEMNENYAGRYIFSGYRTDQPMTMESDVPDCAFTITQNFTANDVEQTKSYQLIKNTTPVPGATEPTPEEPLVYDINILKLAYKEMNFPVPPATPATINIIDSAGTVISTYNIIQKNSKTDPTAYTPKDTDINYIFETGELVLPQKAYEEFRKNGGTISINYDKVGLKEGELNPIVNFTCVMTKDEHGAVVNIPYNMDKQQLEFEFGMNTRIAVNILGKDVYTDKMYADFWNFINFVKSVDISNEQQLRAMYQKGGFGNPPAAPITNEDELDKVVTEHLNREKKALETVLQNRFKNMLGLVQQHAGTVSKQETDLGTRMNRLDLIYSRLEQDYNNYKELMSANEDIDYIEIIMLLKAAESVYQASMMTGARIMQISLVDYIR